MLKWGLHKQEAPVSEVDLFPMTLVEVAYHEIGFSDDEIATLITIISDEIYHSVEELVTSYKQ